MERQHWVRDKNSILNRSFKMSKLINWNIKKFLSKRFHEHKEFKGKQSPCKPAEHFVYVRQIKISPRVLIDFYWPDCFSAIVFTTIFTFSKTINTPITWVLRYTWRRKTWVVSLENPLGIENFYWRSYQISFSSEIWKFIIFSQIFQA